MRFANANDDFKIAKTIVMNAMTRILINFHAVSNQISYFCHYNKCFLVIANEKRSVNQNVNIQNARFRWSFSFHCCRCRCYHCCRCFDFFFFFFQSVRQTLPSNIIKTKMKKTKARLIWYIIIIDFLHIWCYRCVQCLKDNRLIMCVFSSNSRH